MSDFIHLYVHSEYSIIDSIVKIDELCLLAKQNKMCAVAVTDVCNLFAMVKFYSAAIKNKLKPILGVKLLVRDLGLSNHKSEIVLLCKNKTGYLNLISLVTKAYKENIAESIPLIEKQWLADFSQGLIAIDCGSQGAIALALQQDNDSLAQEYVDFYHKYFNNSFYIGLIRVDQKQEKITNSRIISFAKQCNLPVVALNSVVFLRQEDFEAHEARVCIQDGMTLSQENRPRKYTEHQYFKSSQEMIEIFKDIPSAITNSVEIAKRCNLKLTLGESVLPKFKVPDGDTEDSYLAKLAYDGLVSYIETKNKQDVLSIYQDRLNTEIAVITRMGFAGYFLIVGDFIAWARNNGIPVGPGRGSGAGSLVAFCLRITDIDPLQFDLLFERFLNPERVSMPDFDIDFCMDNRDRVIDYVAEHYGRESVSQIATFGTMAAKAVIRDVGRVLSHPYGFVDKIAKLIPFEIGMTLDKALKDEPILKERYTNEEEVKYLLDLAIKLEGITRNVGKHAGGVVIAPSKLTDFVPLYCEDSTSALVTQLDKDDVESIGLVKFDFLGLRTLTIIDWAVKNINNINQRKQLPLININDIPYDDKQTFVLLNNCATTAVFQLESRGMKELISRLKPDNFEEIIALVALFRPGPLQSGMVDDFINRKHGRSKVAYPHPDIISILKPTYGVILYQEQVMQIAQVLAGYSLGNADLLRRAMGKKKAEEMAQQRSLFVDGAMARQVDKSVATYIFDLMEKFAGYGFNKSHSAAYAMISYQTAWLKAHYPSGFMAAVLSADMGHTEKVVHLIHECKTMGLIVHTPNINHGFYHFTVNQDDSLSYGLGAIKGVGEAAILHIVEQRNTLVGNYRNLFDFYQRVDLRKVNKRTIEALIKSGSMDCFDSNRAQLLQDMERAIKHAEQLSKISSTGQGDLFAADSFNDVDNNDWFKVGQVLVPAWDVHQTLVYEKDTMGMFWSGHPINLVAKELQQMQIVNFSELQFTEKERKYSVAGVVEQIKTVQTKKGDRMAIITFEDGKNHFEAIAFADVYQENRELLVKDQLIIFKCIASRDKMGRDKIRLQSVYNLDMIRKNFAAKMNITLPRQELNTTSIDKLKKLIAEQEIGSCLVKLFIQFEHSVAEIELNSCSVVLKANFINGLQEIFPGALVDVNYNIIV